MYDSVKLSPARGWQSTWQPVAVVEQPQHYCEVLVVNRLLLVWAAMLGPVTDAELSPVVITKPGCMKIP